MARSVTAWQWQTIMDGRIVGLVKLKINVDCDGLERPKARN
jgi:hypothetical protein